MKLYWLKIVIVLCVVTILLGFRSTNLSFPSYFPKPVYDFNSNQLSDKKIALGRMLFYDTRLSKNNAISCASCHSSYNAFAHTDHNLSHGINDIQGRRNAPALFNLAWQNSFMWDGAVHHLDMQPLAPISHSDEMGTSIQEVVLKLNQEPLYLDWFKAAFNDSIITGEYVLKALSQFQLTLISANSKYDQFLRGENNLNSKELKGLNLFEKHCNSCHKAPLFSSYEYKNNGLTLDSMLLDYGRYEITKNETDALLFKVPSLRNLSFTYPYMHDGRYRYLKEVINHYDALDTENVLLSKKLRKPLKLSDEDKVNLTAFLLTLNDTSFLFNAAYQYPKALYNIQKTNFN